MNKNSITYDIMVLIIINNKIYWLLSNEKHDNTIKQGKYISNFEIYNINIFLSTKVDKI